VINYVLCDSLRGFNAYEWKITRRAKRVGLDGPKAKAFLSTWGTSHSVRMLPRFLLNWHSSEVIAISGG